VPHRRHGAASLVPVLWAGVIGILLLSNCQKEPRLAVMPLRLEVEVLAAISGRPLGVAVSERVLPGRVEGAPAQRPEKTLVKHLKKIG
jgi:hypothetical protein